MRRYLFVGDVFLCLNGYRHIQQVEIIGEGSPYNKGEGKMDLLLQTKKDAIILDRQLIKQKLSILYFEMHDVIQNCRDEDWHIEVIRRADIFLEFADLLGIEESQRYETILEMYDLRLTLEDAAEKDKKRR